VGIVKIENGFQGSYVGGILMARPLIQIDWEEFDKLCSFQCTLLEISEFFDCSEDTIERAVKREKHMGFADYYKKKSAGGKRSLRRTMYNIAQNGNVTMCIWLSKQMLGYTDKVEQVVDGNSNINLTTTYKSKWGASNEIPESATGSPSKGA
jgi:hypothetical protein